MGFLLVAVILLSPGFSYSSVFSNHLAFAQEDDPNENENNDKNSRLAHLLDRINQLEEYLKQIE